MGEFLWGVDAPPERRCLELATRGMIANNFTPAVRD